MIGTEHEYSINDFNFKAMPISDVIIKEITGKIQNEFFLDTIGISKELQKHVIEFKPKMPSGSIKDLEKMLYDGMKDFHSRTNNCYNLMGLGMHPLLDLNGTAFWDHDEREVFDTYDRVFNLKQHGWLNIQSIQVNVSYSSEDDMVLKHNKIRTMIPYLVALTASSPMVEGKLTKYADNRLIYYKENQKEIPEITGKIIPEPLLKSSDYEDLLEKMYMELKEKEAQVLCQEWVNSRGLIVRRERKCVEIKAMDEQESIHADMAISALINCLIRVDDLNLPDDEEGILEVFETAKKSGTKNLKPELEAIYKKAQLIATNEERHYLKHIFNRIEYGCLSEIITEKYNEEKDILKIMNEAKLCLKENKLMF
ncbi:glutamate--cysteine ligase GCS2 [Methanococcus vannielii SB]|uniref:Glutamate--cysteine ligase GCS2 n=1 Tax=Methanococcus vannielii (strain ATCC 35089 / DSM 1224 / JCM 13029 / OCM 148 / SB) TaxID=406327 RepID=A6US46_METVS|nr:glutamate-cysteine ligase family protein [Methanococcus vannielii]ABR55318.1 glutamate--cysteine ligase GCS2 [Methanococcus vannielii SB]